MTHVPVSVGPQPYPYLEFLPPDSPRYRPHMLDLAQRNMLSIWADAERRLDHRWAEIVNDERRFRERARIQALREEIGRQRDRIEQTATEWLNNTYPGSYARGGLDMGAQTGGSFAWTQAHQDAIGLLAVDTFDSLLRSTTHMERNVVEQVRELARLTTTEKVATGETAKQAGGRLRDRLADQGIAYVTYADGRKVGSKTYAEMVVRTRSAIAYNAGGLNQARADGVEFFEIVDGLDCGLELHKSRPLASGMIVTGDIAGTFPISHPNCVRAFMPRPDLTAENVANLDFESLRDPRSVEDQRAFEQWMRQERAARGQRARSRARSARSSSRAEGRKPRTSRAPAAPARPSVTPSGVAWDAAIEGKTAQEVERSFVAKWGTMVGGGERQIVLSKFGGGARMMAETFDDLFKRYPKVAERIRYVGTTVDVYKAGGRRGAPPNVPGVASNRGLLGFGQKFHSDLEELGRRAQEQKDTGFWATGDPRGVVAHEFGHQVAFAVDTYFAALEGNVNMENLYGRQREHITRPGGGLGIDIGRTVHDAIDAEIGQRVPMRGLSPRNGGNGINVADLLSKYGATNNDELIAEAWAEWITQGPNARPLARAVGRALEQVLDRMPPVPTH